MIGRGERSLDEAGRAGTALGGCDGRRAAGGAATGGGAGRSTAGGSAGRHAPGIAAAAAGSERRFVVRGGASDLRAPGGAERGREVAAADLSLGPDSAEQRGRVQPGLLL